jgi:[acyl-carrier-protein] S-malonyltransferase
MLFVRGLSRDTIEGLCKGRDAAIAIVEPGDAFILGGGRAALEVLADEAKAMNAARVVDVPVEVASHTKRLASASVKFREILSHVPVKLPTVGTRLLSGIDASAVIDVEAGLDKLAAQISQTVQWGDCLEACMEAGATSFLELGPGRALSQMVEGAYPDVATRSLDEFRTLQGARAWLASHASR